MTSRMYSTFLGTVTSDFRERLDNAGYYAEGALAVRHPSDCAAVRT